MRREKWTDPSKMIPDLLIDINGSETAPRRIPLRSFTRRIEVGGRDSDRDQAPML